MTVCQTEGELMDLVAGWRKTGDRIVMTSGVFDLMHRGHVETLRQALSFGDRLIVATNTDASVQRKKGPLRPINPLADRMFMLSSIRFVDAVIAFDEAGEHPVTLVTTVRPDIFVKSSGEWTDKNFFFKEILDSVGGRAERVGHTEGYSTSTLIKRIMTRYASPS